MTKFGFLFMLLLIGTVTLLYNLSCPSKENTIVTPGMVSIGNTNAMTLTMKRRKLKQRTTDDPTSEDVKEMEGNDNLDDYRPIDPIPSSTNSIRPGPVQHGTPLMPYIPEPSPPPS